MLYNTGSVVRKHPVMMYKRIRDPPMDVKCVIVSKAAEVTRHKTQDSVFVMGTGVMAPITHLIHFSGTLNTRASNKGSRRLREVLQLRRKKAPSRN